MAAQKPRSFISADPSKCIGCSICEYVCALEKEGSLNPIRSRVRVIRFHPLFNVAVACRFCEDAPCVRACPRGALKQSESGVIIVDESLCDACGWCIEACEYGGIALHPERKVVMVCDLCGGEPKCIDYCPEEALQLMTEDEIRKAWTSYIERLSEEVARLSELLKERRWASIFMEADERVERVEEKLEKLSMREQELYSSSS